MSQKTPCPTCRRPMYALLYSMVCDHCNPTNAVKAPDRAIKEHRGFIVTSRRPDDLVYRRFYVFSSKASVEEHFGGSVPQGSDVFEVKARKTLEYNDDGDGRIYEVCDRDEAKHFSDVNYDWYDGYVALV